MNLKENKMVDKIINDDNKINLNIYNGIDKIYHKIYKSLLNNV